MVEEINSRKNKQVETIHDLKTILEYQLGNLKQIIPVFRQKSAV